jgi:tetratricopeptide (TPR) repeat protein
MWLQRKQVEKALASLVDARAVAVGAEQVDIDMLAAQMLVEADQYDKALTVTPALEQDPRVARRAMALTGRALAKKGDEAGAEKAFTTALKGASVPEIDYIVAQIEGAYPKATAGANLKKWESLGEDGWRIPMHVGRIMGELGDNAGAVEALLAAATKAPEGKDKLSLYNVLGLTYQSMGKYDEAAKTFQIACKLEPNDGVMNNNLAYCLGLSMNKYAEALPYAERAYKLAPNNPNILDTYGMILVNLDRLKEAEDALNRGLKVVSLASSRYYLGLSLEKQGRKDDALEQYRLGWEMIKKDEKDPSYQKLKDGIARLGGSE